MSKPDIALIYEESLPEDLFQDFKEGLSNEKIKVSVESRPPSGPQACLEWFIFPLVAAYISKPYFEAFFGEMGKDHYAILKKKLSETTIKVMSQPKIEPVLYGTKGKISKDNPYTLAFAIYAEANDNHRFKLLIPKPADDNNYNELIEIFLEFLSEYHSGLKELSAIGFDKNNRPPSGLIFVHVNPATKTIEWLDHMKST
ncbi:MAG: hypothetical protein R3355_11570 [Pseudomonas sp.]|uniref:hypothetical protein n=1 Tax=Pseudomonas sp. TaxID=306 RepID=UPI00299DE1BF|nr:hypothetical protein [Pseudomonas sp.]MDX1723724.1 hypothetical protein [Pseudomonas sp.]